LFQNLDLFVLLSLDTLFADRLQVIGQSQSGTGVNEEFGEVEQIGHLGGTVVLGERVMIVVSAFAQRRHRRPHTLRGRNVHVVRFVAEHVSDGVDEPGGVEHQTIAEQTRHAVRDEGALLPKVDGHRRRNEETEERHEKEIVFSLERQKRIVGQIGEVEFGAHFLQFGVFAHQKPSHVREEEAAIGVVRIGVSVGPFVVTTMVARPFDHVILK